MAFLDWLRNLISGPPRIEAGGAEGDLDLNEEMPVAAEDAASFERERPRAPGHQLLPEAAQEEGSSNIGAFEAAETARSNVEDDEAPPTAKS